MDKVKQIISNGWFRRNALALTAYTLIGAFCFLAGAGVVLLDLLTHGEEMSVLDVGMNGLTIGKLALAVEPATCAIQ